MPTAGGLELVAMLRRRSGDVRSAQTLFALLLRTVLTLRVVSRFGDVGTAQALLARLIRTLLLVTHGDSVPRPRTRMGYACRGDAAGPVRSAARAPAVRGPDGCAPPLSAAAGCTLHRGAGGTFRTVSPSDRLVPAGRRSPDRPPIDGVVHPRYRPVALRFASLFRRASHGGGALTIYRGDELVLDVWGGYRDVEALLPWRRDTMAMSFSTTKGATSTVVHRLVDRGLIDVDATVAAHWPEFGGDGRDEITVRQLLSHQAGLHRIRRRVSSAEEMLDHEAMIDLVSSQRPSPRPGRVSGYHGITYGWLVAGLCRAVTGKSIGQLVQEEIVEPLDLDGMYIGTPRDQHHRVASLYPRPPAYMHGKAAARLAERVPATRGVAAALMVDGFEDLWFEPERRLLETEMPAANGVFTARSLATMYAALANRGRLGDVRFLSEETVRLLGKVQRRDRDIVLGLPMRWRLGYHHAFIAGRPMPKAFGHFGYGGSGGWADPETGLSVAFVTNRLGNATTPIGDVRLVRLGALTRQCAGDP